MKREKQNYLSIGKKQLGKGREESPLGPIAFQELFYVYSLHFRGIQNYINVHHSKLQKLLSTLISACIT